MSQKTWDRETVIQLLETNDLALAKAVSVIYRAQTADEQSALQTKERNGVGFNGTDAPFLSSIAQKLPRYDNRMTQRQIAKVRPMMKKYWAQLLKEIERRGGAVCYDRSVTPEQTPTETAAETIKPTAQAAHHATAEGAWA